MKNRSLAIATGLPLVAGVALAFVVSYASAQTVGERDGRLADASGRTLYTFDRDAAGASNCNDACAKVWPPFAAKDDASAKGAWTIVSRADGSRQWALDGKPLYVYAGDAKAGDAFGDGQGGVWHAVKRATKTIAAPAITFNPDYARGGY